MKKFVLAVIVMLCTTVLSAQDEEGPKGFNKDKLFAGGGFGLSFGNYTLITLSPQMGYRFNRYLSSGLGINLQYASQKEKNAYGDYSKVTQGIIGLNLFTRFYPVQRFLIQLQPEGNYIFGNVRYYQPPEGKYKLDAQIVPSVLVGGGIAMPTQKGAFLTTIMYDVLQNPDSPYGNRPIVNVTYNFKF